MLHERAQALSVLTARWRQAVAGAGSIVIITGDAGIGKTSVVRAFRESVTEARVLTGACDDLRTPRALGALRDAGLVTDPDAVFDGTLDELRAQLPTLLIVEDLHWADDATLDVLAFVARRIEHTAVLVVVTIRDGAAPPGHPLHRWLGGLAGLPVRRIALPSLSRAAVSEMAADSPWDGDALFELTGGNPFYVTEALAAPRGGVPETVADAVLARVHRLAAPCVDALERLSVVPNLVDYELAEALLPDGLDQLEAAEAGGILDTRADGIAFRHELARRAVESGLSGLRRRSLHRNVIGLLRAQSNPDLARLVHHGLAAADADTIIRYAAQAGRESAAAGSHRQALAHFEAALRFSDALDTEALARLLDDYAWELYNAHHFAEAVEHAERAVRLFVEVGDPIALAEARVRLSRHHYMLGNTRHALSVARAARRGAETASTAMAYGCLLALVGESAEATTVLDRAAALARETGRDDLVELWLNYQSLARADLDADGRIALLQASLDQSVAAGHFEHAARAYTNLGEILFRNGRLDALDECLSAGLRFTGERGFGSHAFNLEVHRGLLRLRRGDWEAARAVLDDIAARDADPGMLRVYSVPWQARLRARRTGPAAEVEAELVDAWQTALAQQSLLAIAYAGAALAEYAWLASKPELCAPVFNEWLRHAGRPDAGPAWGEVLRYCQRAGLDVRAAVDTGLDDVPLPWAAGVRGDWAAAAEAWETVGDPYERALELLDSRDGDQMRAALVVLDALGAHGTVATVRRRLKVLGVKTVPRGPVSSTRAHPAGLTARQADVLDLLVQGLTNAEIAERLYLSVRTVDHHVSSILSKLGVSSRREVRAAVRTLSV